MGCGSFGVTQVLVGLHRVGVVGLGDALRRVDDSGLSDREAVVDFMMGVLAGDNYVPDSMAEAFRLALWREHLRSKGEDFSDFYSEVDVVVRGDEGEQREQFVARLESVLAFFELTPVIEYAPPRANEPSPQLVIGDQVVVRGLLGEEAFKAAVRTSISDW